MMLGCPHKLSWKRQDSSKAMVQSQGEVQATPHLQARTREHNAPHPTAYILLLEEGSLTAGQSRVLRDLGGPGEGREAPLKRGCGRHSAHVGWGPATAVHLLKLFYNIARAFKIIPFLQNIPS